MNQLDALKPLTTVVADGNQHGLVVPLRTNGYASSTEEVVPTVTAGGNHHGLLMRNNTERSGEAWACTPTTEPTRTVTTAGHQSLLLPNRSTQPARPVSGPAPTSTTTATVGLVNLDTVVDDCGFRMLEPYEVAGAMAFPPTYIPRTLPKKDQVKLAGNAVTPPVMSFIVGRIIQAMEGR